MENQIKSTKEDILKVLPHRDPMIFVDGVVEINKDSIITYKEVHGDEYYFKGHFPNNKILPGVFIVESAAQSSIILLSQFENNLTDFTPLLYHTDFKFKKVVKPNTVMYVTVKLIRMIGYSAIVESVVKVENQVVAKGKLSFVCKINKEEGI